LRPNAPTESAVLRAYPPSRRSVVRLPALSITTPTFLKQTQTRLVFLHIPQPPLARLEASLPPTLTLEGNQSPPRR
jgi:hypothetical protein